MKYFIFLIMFFVSISSFANEEIVGKVSYIVDGDTIFVNKIKIRLEGIDSPELKQLCKNKDNKDYRCGVSATEFLKSIIENKEVKCFNQGKDVYKRILGICYIDDLNINQEMVKSGNAVATNYGNVDYIDIEKQAVKSKLGIWQGSFTTPHRWRMKFGHPDKDYY